MWRRTYLEEYCFDGDCEDIRKERSFRRESVKGVKVRTEDPWFLFFFLPLSLSVVSMGTSFRIGVEMCKREAEPKETREERPSEHSPEDEHNNY